jgi:hypothetical protein
MVGIKAGIHPRIFPVQTVSVRWGHEQAGYEQHETWQVLLAMQVEQVSHA